MTQRRSRPLTALALGLVLLLAAGCGETEIIPAPIRDLGEPWQAQPFPINPALIAAAERVCREPMMQMVPAGTSLVLVDARGGNRLLLLFAGPGASGECLVTRDRTGALMSNGGGSTVGQDQRALGATEIVLQGVGSQTGMNGPNEPEVTISYTTGRAGAGVAAVEIRLGSGNAVMASLNRGVFAAWWPGNDSSIVARGFDASGSVIGSSN